MQKAEVRIRKALWLAFLLVTCHLSLVTSLYPQTVINGSRTFLGGQTKRVWLPAAACQNVTASVLWDVFPTLPPVAACVTGTNTVKGVAEFADGADTLSMQVTVMLPADFTGTLDATFKWYTSAITGSVVWQMATVCVGDAETDDPAFNTASVVIDAAKGTTLQLNDATITGVTITGCAAGELMHVKVLRNPAHASDDLAATANLIGVELTTRRTQ